MSVRAAIFDLDGTLADSVADIAAALNAALVEAGHAPFDVAGVTNMVGAGARRLIERALVARGATPDPSRVDILWATFMAYYDAHPCVHTKLYPGARATLEALAAEGWALGVCTNKPETVAREVIAALGIGPLFGSIVGGRDGIPLKPAPDMVHRVLSELGATAGGSVFIGDSSADVEAAHAAGLPVALLAHGYSDRPVTVLGADKVFDGFDGLVAAIHGLRRAGGGITRPTV